MGIEYKQVILFLQKNGWQNSGRNDRFEFFKPPIEMGFPEDYQLPVPIRFQAPDYSEYLKHTASVIANFYDKKPQEIFDSVEYLDNLRDRAIYLKLSSTEVKFDHTLAFSEIGKFINNLTDSYLAYLEVKFKQLFSQSIFLSNQSKVKKVLNKLKEVNDLRLVDLQFKSFSFGVSTDVIHDNSVLSDSTVIVWRKQALSEFEADVLKADYYSKDGIEKIKAIFNEEERRMIYNPILKSLNSKTYKVNLTNSSYVSYKSLRHVPMSTVTEIVPPADKENPLTDVKFYNVTIPVEKGKRKMISQEVIEGDLFAKQVDSFSLEMITGTNRRLELVTPLKVKPSSANSMYYLSLEGTDLEVVAEKYEEAKQLLISALWSLYDQYNQGDEAISLRDDYEVLSRIFEEAVLVLLS